MRLNKIRLGVKEAPFFYPKVKRERRAAGAQKNFLNTKKKIFLCPASEDNSAVGGRGDKYDGSEKSLKMLYKGRNIPLLDKSPPINRLPMPIS